MHVDRLRCRAGSVNFQRSATTRCSSAPLPPLPRRYGLRISRQASPRSLAIGLALLRAVDAAEVGVQDFESVAVEDGDDEVGEVGSIDNGWDEQSCQQQKWCPVRDHDRRTVVSKRHRGARR
jgi:hypothetical protein